MLIALSFEQVEAIKQPINRASHLVTTSYLSERIPNDVALGLSVLLVVRVESYRVENTFSSKAHMKPEHKSLHDKAPKYRRPLNDPLLTAHSSKTVNMLGTGNGGRVATPFKWRKKVSDRIPVVVT